MEVDKSDIEWLLMMIVMLIQGFPIDIKININTKQKPSKKRKPRKQKR